MTKSDKICVIFCVLICVVVVWMIYFSIRQRANIPEWKKSIYNITFYNSKGDSIILTKDERKDMFYKQAKRYKESIEKIKGDKKRRE